MARHAERTPPPPPPRTLLVDRDPVPEEQLEESDHESGHYTLILGVVAMLCATALATSMVVAGHGDSVGGLLIACVLAGGAVKVVDLLRKIILAVLDHFW
jgi:hypothetical protein